MGLKLFDLILKIIIVAPKTFQIFIFVLERFSSKKFERFSWKCSNFINFELEKCLHHYQSAESDKDGSILTKCHIRAELEIVATPRHQVPSRFGDFEGKSSAFCRE